ncbi:hypothetical protein HMI56_002169 [Coelomomyces lativittatus]|nr:hypothetical protein HMI56_002169 [Coelomomyces lativittatus]
MVNSIPCLTHPVNSEEVTTSRVVNAPRLQPSYAKDIHVTESQHGFYESMLTVIGSTIGFLGSIPCCFCLPNPYHIVEQGSVGLIAKFGKCNRTVDPGLYKINLMTESLQKGTL